MSSQLNGVIDVIDAARDARSSGMTWSTFVNAFRNLGADYLNIGAVDPKTGEPVWVLSSMRNDWLDHYVDRRFYQVDPFLALAMNGHSPGRWSKDSQRSLPYIDDPRTELLNAEMAEAGYHVAYGVPTGVDQQGLRRIVCFGAGNRDRVFDDPERETLFQTYAVLASLFINPNDAMPQSMILDRRPRLTPREKDVLSLLANGHMNARIADRLGIAEISVRKHMLSARKKLGVRTREQAIAYTITHRLIDI